MPVRYERNRGADRLPDARETISRFLWVNGPICATCFEPCALRGPRMPVHQQHMTEFRSAWLADRTWVELSEKQPRGVRCNARPLRPLFICYQHASCTQCCEKHALDMVAACSQPRTLRGAPAVGSGLQNCTLPCAATRRFGHRYRRRWPCECELV